MVCARDRLTLTSSPTYTRTSPSKASQSLSPFQFSAFLSLSLPFDYPFSFFLFLFLSLSPNSSSHISHLLHVKLFRPLDPPMQVSKDFSVSNWKHAGVPFLWEPPPHPTVTTGLRDFLAVRCVPSDWSCLWKF